MGCIAFLYFLICNQVYRCAKLERTRRMWLLFSHSTAIFIITSIQFGCDLKLFEMFYVTCWEDPTRISLAGEICLGLVVWLQDGLLVNGLAQCKRLLLTCSFQLYRFWVLGGQRLWVNLLPVLLLIGFIGQLLLIGP